MNLFKRLVGHTKTVLKHKWLVCKICFKFGLYSQGIVHDMSKFSPTEFITSVKYFQGNRSPINAEKEDKGFSMGWMHHHNHNKHHWLYWVDFNDINEVTPVRIPFKYAVESIADWVAAGMTYEKENFTWDEPYEYYKKNTRIGSEQNIDYATRQLWDIMLVDLKNYGIDYVARHVKNGNYKAIYDTPKDENGNIKYYNQKHYMEIVEEYYNK